MTTNDTYVGKYIQPCTPQLALEVGENLRWEDIREVEGVTPDNKIWMLCTKASEEYPHTFVREARRWLDSLHNPYLWNHADMRNESHIKLLKLLKFTFINYQVHNGVPLIQFVKLCVNQ
jgi:hypothetical protein